jgi:hypothetical protein
MPLPGPGRFARLPLEGAITLTGFGRLTVAAIMLTR